VANEGLSGNELRRQASRIQETIEFRCYRELQCRYVAGGVGYGPLRDLTLALVEQVRASGWRREALILAVELAEIRRGRPRRYEDPELGRYLACIRDLRDAHGDTAGDPAP
jgi:hypothetical protein